MWTPKPHELPTQTNPHVQLAQRNMWMNPLFRQTVWTTEKQLPRVPSGKNLHMPCQSHSKQRTYVRTCSELPPKVATRCCSRRPTRKSPRSLLEAHALAETRGSSRSARSAKSADPTPLPTSDIHMSFELEATWPLCSPPSSQPQR